MRFPDTLSRNEVGAHYPRLECRRILDMRIQPERRNKDVAGCRTDMTLGGDVQACRCEGQWVRGR